ncbi:cell surface protein [Coniochaeta ligniaria NRRL 30616]|uniref:Cell surface protein n=1 Tax=Coniochaeta ligniaria NRRL 30616 TaxID=1408157 RepID=A0A1J7K1Q9_9PEZI|nr:cell surface protein [Coniochaeta ligniaria NRRL 30616]
MFSKLIVLALAISPLVAAHGKVAVVTGDAGGNGTALAIKGAVVPGPGPNSKTEVDTTVFSSTKIQTDGLGRTTGSGKNKVAMLNQTMALSGSTLPQVSATNGTIEGTFHIVTTDGAGPIQAVLDPTATGSFSNGTMLTTVTQVPGNNGNIKAPKQRSLLARALVAAGIVKRAANVNEDFPMKFSVPAGTTCSGTVNGISNVCLVKIANSNKAGPFGGVVAVQIAGQTATAAKRAVEFSA